MSQQTPLEEFTEWFVKNYPGPTTIIHDPNWHAPKIFRAATRSLELECARLAQEKKKVEEEATEYWAFISAVAHYFGCKEGVDMRDFIVKKMDELKESAMRGEALARTVMLDQTGKDKP